jgi:hypothetical protein
MAADTGYAASRSWLMSLASSFFLQASCTSEAVHFVHSIHLDSRDDALLPVRGRLRTAQ